MRYLLTFFLICRIYLFSIAQSVTPFSIFFDHDQAALTPEGTATLDQVAQIITTAPDYEINLNAYTDNTGTATYNQQLANDRANAVRQYLANKGLFTDKIAVTSWGESKQRFNNNSAENRQKNRRVDIELNIWKIDSPETFQKRLQSKTNLSYTIDNMADQTINTPAGTTVIVPAGSFTFEDGTTPTGPVELTIKEALKPGDWLINGLATTSNGQILQSGGMLYIGATSNGKELQLAEGAEITVALPALKGVDPEMQLFYGQHNTTDNTAVSNWQVAPGDGKFRQTIDNPSPVYTLPAELSARIRQMKVAVPTVPEIPAFAQLNKPSKPVEPTKPRLRAAPEWSKVARLYSADGNPKGKKLKLAKQEFAESQLKYQKDSVAFESAMLIYQSRLQQYEVQRFNYHRDHQAWKNGVKERLEFANKYQVALKTANTALAINMVLKTVGKKKPFKYRNLNSDILNRVEHVASFRSFKKNYYGTHDPNAPVYKQIFGAEAIKNDTELRDWITDYPSKRVCDYSWGTDSSYLQIRNLLDKSGLTAISDSLSLAHKETEALSGISGVQQRAMASYVTEITQLGWVNCDRFLKDPSPRITLTFEAKDAFAMYAYFPQINSMLMLTKDLNTGKFITDGVPEGQRFKLITLKTDNGHLWVNQQQLTASQKLKATFEYTAYTMNAFRKELELLN